MNDVRPQPMREWLRILSAENRGARRKTCLSVTLFTTNPTSTALWRKTVFCDETPAQCDSFCSWVDERGTIDVCLLQKAMKENESRASTAAYFLSHSFHFLSNFLRIVVCQQLCQVTNWAGWEDTRTLRHNIRCCLCPDERCSRRFQTA
jgi:hypothetical protein